MGISIHHIIHNEKGEESLLKIAFILASIDDSKDKEIIEFFRQKGYKCVITRAGGRGDNFKYKLFRNIIAASENAEVIYKNPENEYTLYRSIEKIVSQFNDKLENICGGGAKIGIVSRNSHLAIAVYGTIGIPGINVDREFLAMDIQYYSLKF